ncbi:MAG: hypothetical protein ABIO70_28055, partial [Pseudomonadota bacterium]
MLLRAAFLGLAGLFAVGLVAILLALARLPHTIGVLLLGLTALPLLLLPPLLPAARGWRPAGDRVRQARLAEARRPATRGRLVTLAERPAGPAPG